MAILGPLSRFGRAMRRNLPPVNFITLHYAYFISTCLIAAIIFWGSSTPARSVSFTDSLFLAVSAMTLAGLNTVNLSTLNTFQQFIMFLLIMLGSAIFVSAFVVQVRLRAFEKKFQDIVAVQRKKKLTRRRSISITRPMSFARSFQRDVDTSSLGPHGHRTIPTNTATYPGSTNAEGDKAGSDLDPPVDEMEGGKANGPAHDDLEGQTKIGADGRPERPRLTFDLPGADHAHEKRSQLSGVSPARDRSVLSSAGPDGQPYSDRFSPMSRNGTERVMFSPDTVFRMPPGEFGVPLRSQSRHRVMDWQGVGARSGTSLRRSRTTLAESTANVSATNDGQELSIKERPMNEWEAWTRKHLGLSGDVQFGRNSQFYNLSEEDKERLGGYEYRAIYLLAWIVPLYFVLWQLLSCLGLAAYVAHNRPDTARTNGLNPWWVGAFNAVSAFNNSGMSLLDANMTAFQTSIYMLITMSLLILAGNTCYPVFLRLIVWTMWKLLPENEYWKDEKHTLRFLLDHPRRCYTNLFPSQHTWWLLTSVLTLNGFDWVMFEVLNIGNNQITKLGTGYQILDGLFQAFAVRSGGFYVVPIPNVRISLQVLYVVMMYISVYPVVITMRNSNVYEERSLGIYADDPGYENEMRGSGYEPGGVYGFVKNRLFKSSAQQQNPTPTPNGRESRGYFVQQQLRAQLAHDLWWLVLAVFLIMIIENSNFEANPATFSVFNVIFETVSAYGTVGISLGVPYDAYSFCGAWHTLSKLILCAVMLRGRHRGLPVAIDKAVMLPSEAGHEAEQEDAQIRQERSTATLPTLERSISQGSAARGRSATQTPVD